MSDGNKGSVLGQIFVAVAVALIAGGTAPWWLKFLTQPPVDETPPPTPSVSPTSNPSTLNKDQTFWDCRAKGSHSILYIVNKLDPDKDDFDLAIYENANEYGEGDYIGTVVINITEKSDGIVGTGRLGSRSIGVEALGRPGRAFSVQDDRAAGAAIGECFINTDVVSRERKELERYCLSVAARQTGNIAPMQRFGCERDPNKYLKELQSQERSKMVTPAPATPAPTPSDFNSHFNEWLKSRESNKN